MKHTEIIRKEIESFTEDYIIYGAKVLECENFDENNLEEELKEAVIVDYNLYYQGDKLIITSPIQTAIFEMSKPIRVYKGWLKISNGSRPYIGITDGQLSCNILSVSKKLEDFLDKEFQRIQKQLLIEISNIKEG